MNGEREVWWYPVCAFAGLMMGLFLSVHSLAPTTLPPPPPAPTLFLPSNPYRPPRAWPFSSWTTRWTSAAPPSSSASQRSTTYSRSGSSRSWPGRQMSSISFLSSRRLFRQPLQQYNRSEDSQDGSVAHCAVREAGRRADSQLLTVSEPQRQAGRGIDCACVRLCVHA